MSLSAFIIIESTEKCHVFLCFLPLFAMQKTIAHAIMIITKGCLLYTSNRTKVPSCYHLSLQDHHWSRLIKYVCLQIILYRCNGRTRRGLKTTSRPRNSKTIFNSSFLIPFHHMGTLFEGPSCLLFSSSSIYGLIIHNKKAFVNHFLIFFKIISFSYNTLIRLFL